MERSHQEILRDELMSSVSGFCNHILDYFPLKILIIITVVFLLHFIFLKPVNWVRNEIINKVGRRRIGSLPPVYPNGWYALVESSDLSKEQVIHVSALGENFAVFRTKGGDINILDAYCPHLGANMAVGGRVIGSCLECPFHLWRFSGEDGFCTSTSNISKVPKSTKVKKWFSHECNDYIFVWYHAEDQEPSWYPIQLENLNKLSFQGRNEYQVNCHIQEIPENGSDTSHFIALHEAFALGGGDLRSMEPRWLKLFRHDFSATWEAGSTPEDQHIGKGSLLHYFILFQKFKCGKCDIKISQMGPGYVTLEFDTSLGPMILLQTVTPIEPLLQRVTHRIYSPIYLSIYAKFILLSECYMFERDVMIWNNKKYLKKPLLLKEDNGIGRHRRWFSQFYTEHSPTYESAKEGIEW